MLSMVARSVLRKAVPDIQFRAAGDLVDPERVQRMEIGVWRQGRCIGHLECRDMPDNVGGVFECFGRYGRLWDEEEKAKGYRLYVRDGWRRCLNEIIGHLPEDLVLRLKKELRKRGYRL